MSEVTIENLDIPHGHGLSYKKGIADDLLENRDHEESCHDTHLASYNTGQEIAIKLIKEIAKCVKA